MTRNSESGAALLTVLLIVAALSAIAVAGLDDLRRAQRLEANAASMAQARWYAIGAEDFAASFANEVRNGPAVRTAFAEGPQRFTLPLDHGLMEIEVRDASTCINLNSVVAGAGEVFQRHEAGAAQFAALLVALDMPAQRAEEMTNDLVAWIDTTDSRAGPGPDDSPYLGLAPGYMTGREPLAEISELRAVRGFGGEVFSQLRPLVCALPRVGPSPVNVNALTPAHAPVLVAVSQGALSYGAARALIESRPALGWATLEEMMSRPELSSIVLPEDARSQLVLEPVFLHLTVHVTHLDAEVTMTQLLIGNGPGFDPAGRRWSTES